jgi:mannose-6-phosphate isomerase-like protein (cupin superfamily)
LGSFFHFPEREIDATVKRLIFLLVTSGLAIAGQSTRVDIYTARDLHAIGEKLMQKRTQFASQDLERYGNHYLMVAERGQTGSSELHEHEADIFVVESGNATIITGGKIVNPHTQKPGEIRGSSIEGGERHHLGVGDIIHLPAGTPHQLLIDRNQPFTYFVIKVQGQ